MRDFQDLFPFVKTSLLWSDPPPRTPLGGPARAPVGLSYSIYYILYTINTL